MIYVLYSIILKNTLTDVHNGRFGLGVDGRLPARSTFDLCIPRRCIHSPCHTKGYKLVQPRGEWTCWTRFCFISGVYVSAIGCRSRQKPGTQSFRMRRPGWMAARTCHWNTAVNGNVTATSDVGRHLGDRGQRNLRDCIRIRVSGGMSWHLILSRCKTVWNSAAVVIWCWFIDKLQVSNVIP